MAGSGLAPGRPRATGSVAQLVVVMNGSAVPATRRLEVFTEMSVTGSVIAGAGGGSGAMTTLRSSVAKLPALSRARSFTR